MPQTNTITAANGNETAQYDLQVRDTNDHDPPDVDGDDSAGGDPYAGANAGRLAVKVVNSHDQDATVRLEATTRDDDAVSTPSSPSRATSRSRP